MQHRPQKFWLGRCYWQAAKRWPVVHALGCCCGLFVGCGALNLFWDPQPNKRQDVLLRPLGVFMLIVYGWWFIAFLLRLKRGTWKSHCASRILFFSGIEPSTGKHVASARPAKSIDFTSNQILAASLANLALATLLFVDVHFRWHGPFFTPMLVSIGLFSNPVLSYIAVRRMTETGFSWRWFFSAVLGLLGYSLWVLAVLIFYFRIRQLGHP